MEAVGDHQFHIRLPAGRDHLPTLPHRHRHRFLAQHVDPGLRGPNGVLGVHRVRQRDVHGVDQSEAFLELVVGEGVIEPVALRDLAPLRAIAAHHRNQLRVPPRMRKSRQHRYLCDVSQSDDGVANFSFGR